MSKPIPPRHIMKLILTTLTLIVAATYLGQAGEKKQTLPEYNAVEAKKHIGETVRIKIDNESGVPRIFVKSTSQIVPHRH